MRSMMIKWLILLAVPAAVAACSNDQVTRADLSSVAASADQSKSEADRALQTAQQALQTAQQAEQQAERMYDRSLHK